MKVAVIAYHKNAETIYKKEWIDEFRNSVLNQTYSGFDLYELNYGGGDFRIFENANFHSKEFPSFVYALNYLLDSLFFAGYDCVANTNCDDICELNRLEKQIPFIEAGYDIVSSNFSLIKENGGIFQTNQFDKLNIGLELENNHNIICHPSVVYSSSFWKRHRYVPEQQPREDMMLWQRAVKDSKFIILPDILIYHRLHENSVCQSENK